MSSGDWSSGLTDSAGKEFYDPMQDFDDSGSLDAADAISPKASQVEWKEAIPDVLAMLGGSGSEDDPMRLPDVDIPRLDVDFSGVPKSSPFEYKPLRKSQKRSA